MLVPTSAEATRSPAQRVFQAKYSWRERRERTAGLIIFLIILSITFPMRDDQHEDAQDDQLYSSLLRLLTGILPSVCTC